MSSAHFVRLEAQGEAFKIFGTVLAVAHERTEPKMAQGIAMKLMKQEAGLHIRTAYPLSTIARNACTVKYKNGISLQIDLPDWGLPLQARCGLD